MLRHKDVPGLVLRGGYWWHPQSAQPLAHFWAEFTHHGVLFEAADQRFYETASWQKNTYAINVKAYTEHTAAQIIETLGAPTWEGATRRQQDALRRRLVSDLVAYGAEYVASLGVVAECHMCGRMSPATGERVPGKLYCRCSPSTRTQHAVNSQLRVRKMLGLDAGDDT